MRNLKELGFKLLIYLPASSKYILIGVTTDSAKFKKDLNSFTQKVIDVSLPISYRSNSPFPSANCVRIVFDKPRKYFYFIL